MNKSEKILGMIEKMLPKLDRECQSHIAGQGQVGNLAQLQCIKDSLLQIQLDVKKGQIWTKEEKRRYSYGRLIADSWPVKDPHNLGDELLAIEHLYKEM